MAEKNFIISIDAKLVVVSHRKLMAKCTQNKLLNQTIVILLKLQSVYLTKKQGIMLPRDWPTFPGMSLGTGAYANGRTTIKLRLVRIFFR